VSSGASKTFYLYNEYVEEVRLIEEERKKERSASQALTQVIQYSGNC